MKKILISFLFLGALSTFADSTFYSNADGCEVEVYERKHGVIMYVNKDKYREVLGYGNEYSFADFSYCAEDYIDISSFQGAKGTGVIIGCSGHQNGHKTTRGRVDISLDSEGNPVEIKLDGQVKGFFSWKQDVMIECLNLVKVEEL